MIVKLGNGFYFLYIGIAAVFFLLLLLILWKRGERTKRAVLLAILFFNFALHYLKQAFPPYINDQPQSLSRSTVQNLCAVSTVFFPFIFLIKKQNILHDFMYFIGMCGGFAALAFPTEALGMPAFAFDTIRFYLCHISLFAVPLASAVLGLYRPRLSRFWAIPLLFLLWETVICLNEFYMIGVGLVKAKPADLLNAGFRNSSFAFGVRPDFAWAKKLFDPLVPSFFRTDAFHINGGKPFYFPVLWLIVPAFVYLIPVYVVLSSPFWILSLVRRQKQKRAAR